MRLEVEVFAKDVGSRHQVVVQDVLISWLQPRGNDDVRVEALVEAKVPSMIASQRLPASGKDERRGVLRIDLQEVSLGVDADRRP